MKSISLFLFVIATTIFCSSCSSKKEIKSRNFQLTYKTYINEIPQNSKNLKLWIPLPSNNDFQTINNLNISSTPKIDWIINKEKVYGNRMIHATIDSPPPSIEMTLTMEVKRRENKFPYSKQPPLSKQVTLSANRLIPINYESKKIADKYAGHIEIKQEKAKAFIHHTLDHMAYDKSGSGWGRGDFQFACNVGRGNCTDFHAYFIGLCRSVGIPAYFEIGLPLPTQRGSGKTGGYHCWAYYQNKGIWNPVDISEADKDPEQTSYFLENHCENRVAFSIGRDLVLEPPQQGEPLNYFIAPYVEIDNQKHLSVNRETLFKDIDL